MRYILRICSRRGRDGFRPRLQFAAAPVCCLNPAAGRPSTRRTAAARKKEIEEGGGRRRLRETSATRQVASKSAHLTDCSAPFTAVHIHSIRILLRLVRSSRFLLFPSSRMVPSLSPPSPRLPRPSVPSGVRACTSRQTEGARAVDSQPIPSRRHEMHWNATHIVRRRFRRPSVC